MLYDYFASKNPSWHSLSSKLLIIMVMCNIALNIKTIINAEFGLIQVNIDF